MRDEMDGLSVMSSGGKRCDAASYGAALMHGVLCPVGPKFQHKKSFNSTETQQLRYDSTPGVLGFQV